MNKSFKLDDIDKKILKELVKDTRTPFTEIAKKLGVSAGTIHVRMDKLEKAEIVQGSSLVLNYDKLNYSFIAYVGILLTKSDKTQNVVNQLQKIPNVTVGQIISGKYNIFCKIRAKDTQDAKDIIFKIDAIDDVLRTESMIVLEESFNDKKRLMNKILQ